MKLAKLFGILLLSLLSIGLTGCNDDEKTNEPYPLTISKTSYEVPINDVLSISISEGNGKYTLKMEDPTIAGSTVYATELYDDSYGKISVQGKQKGETSLLVTDDVTKETVRLQIKVTDNYVPFFIIESNHPALAKNVWIYLINNEARDCYFLTNADEASQSPSSKLLSKGNYAFSIENAITHLTLTYVSDSNGKFFIGEVVPTAHEFDISRSTSKTLSILQYLLQLDWGTPANETRMTAPESYELKMDEVNTEYKTTGILKDAQIPEGILK